MRSKRLLVAAKLVVSLGLIAWLLYLADPSRVWARLANVDIVPFAFGLMLLFCQTWLSAGKWRWILRADGVVQPFFPLLRIYFIGGFLSLFLPTSFGGDIYRVAAIRNSVHLAEGTASVLFDRLTGLFALLCLALVGLVAVAGSRVIGGWALLVLSVGVVGFLLLNSRLAVRWLEAMETNRVLAFPAKLVRSFQAYRRSPTMVVGALFISAIFQLNTVIINSAYAKALGLDIEFSALLMVVPLAYLTEMLPVSINGIGIRETALVALLVSIGYPADYGLAIGILIIAGRYLIGLIGGSLLLTSSIKNNQRLATTERN